MPRVVLNCSDSLLFHGGDTGSTPIVGTSNKYRATNRVTNGCEITMQLFFSCVTVVSLPVEIRTRI